MITSISVDRDNSYDYTKLKLGAENGSRLDEPMKLSLTIQKMTSEYFGYFSWGFYFFSAGFFAYQKYRLYST